MKLVSWPWVGSFLVVTLCAPASPVSAQVIKNLQFDVDGVLPTSDPEITFYDNGVDPVFPESTFFSVAGGVLAQRSFGVWNTYPMYGHPTAPGNLGAGNPLDPLKTTVLEYRAKVLQIEGIFGVRAEFYDGEEYYGISLESSGVWAFDSTWTRVQVPVNVFDYHTYRLEAAGGTNAFRLFVDGQLVLVSSAPALLGFNGFVFGDDSALQGESGDADWDYLRVWQCATPASVIHAPRVGSTEILGIDTTSLTTTVETSAIVSNPNGSGWDDVNRRLYYSSLTGGNLYVWEETTDAHASLGSVSAFGGPPNPGIASASFHAGSYYFIPDHTADLWRVTFDGTPGITSVTLVADLTPDSTTWHFGDIAIDEHGVLFGSGLRDADGLSELFRHDLAAGAFASIRAESAATFPSLQLAFDGTGIGLIGSNASNGEWFDVDRVTGALTLTGAISPPVADLSNAITLGAAPTLSCPPVVVVFPPKASLPRVPVTYSVSAVDDCDPFPSVVCTPPSGSLFPRGTTIVQCTATDADGNVSTCSFAVHVLATTLPR